MSMDGRYDYQSLLLLHTIVNYTINYKPNTLQYSIHNHFETVKALIGDSDVR